MHFVLVILGGTGGMRQCAFKQLGLLEAVANAVLEAQKRLVMVAFVVWAQWRHIGGSWSIGKRNFTLSLRAEKLLTGNKNSYDFTGVNQADRCGGRQIFDACTMRDRVWAKAVPGWLAHA